MKLSLSRKNIIVTFLVCFLLFVLFLLSFSSFKRKSITLDEEKYINAGRIVYQEFDFDSGLMILHPPLTYYIQGLSRFVFPAQDPKLELFYARLTMQPLLLIFALVIFLVAKKKYGVYAGFLSLLLFVFNNEILTHGRLIDIDISLAFFIFVSLISFYYFLKNPNFKNTFLTGLFLGLAFLTKYNALFLIPILLITLTFYLIIKEKRLNISLILKFKLIILLAIFLIHLGYLFQGSLKIPDKFDSVLFNKLENNRITKNAFYIFPKFYLAGMDYQYHLSKTGWIGFLMGETKWGGWKHFYLVFFLIKTPIPFLFLLTLYLFFGRKGWFERYMLFAALFFFAYLSLFNIINNGMRYILMCYPILMVLISSIVANKLVKKSKVLIVTVIVLILWYIAELLMIYPHYFAYFNQIIGGPKNGYLYAADSNLDFGQDRDEANTFLSQHPEITFNPQEPVLGKVAVNVNFLNFNGKEYWLRRLNKKPTEHINFTYLIFDITEDDLNSLSSQSLN